MIYRIATPIMKHLYSLEDVTATTLDNSYNYLVSTALLIDGKRRDPYLSD